MSWLLNLFRRTPAPTADIRVRRRARLPAASTPPKP